MISPARRILVLADDRVAAELTSTLGQGRFAHRAEPYAALEELARDRYDVLLLTHPWPEFSALLRAARRVRRSLLTFALCSPAGEADLRIAAGDDLDDYFIYPPTREELERIQRAPADEPAAAPAPAVEAAPAGANLPPDDIAAMVEAAGTIDGLADSIAERVALRTGLSVRWAGPCGDPGARALLLLGTDPPRALVCDTAAEIALPARAYLEALQVLLGPLAAQARRTHALHHLATTDFLTGAYNRRYFYRFSDQLLRRARVERFRATLLLYDIDNFKRYNDTYGHAAGDEVLRETARLMQQITRADDIVARIGGDEFAVLFWDAEPPRRADSKHPETPVELAGRFIKAIATHEFPSLGPEATGVLTISGGLANFPWDGTTCVDLLRRADKALREAKASGKNAIHLVGRGDINGGGA